MRGFITSIGVPSPITTIEHKGQTLDFSASVFGRRSLGNEDLFQYINLYWESLSETEQDEIFNIYQTCSILFCTGGNWTELSEGLKKEINKLFQYHNLDNMKNWIGFKTDIAIPASIAVEFIDDINSKNSRVKTYIKSEYAELLTLSLLLRAMVPIWGEFIFTTRSEFGNDFKELFAFLLISESDVYQHNVFRRLTEYIAAVLASDKADDKSIESGISSEDYVLKRVALVCVRKLCVAPLKPVDPNAHLCTSIHNYITPQKGMSTGHPEEIIREKAKETGADDPNKLSSYERFRASCELSPGNIVEFNEFFRPIVENTFSLFPKTDQAVLDECLARVPSMMVEQFREPQIKLMKLVFSPIIPIEAFDYIDSNLQVLGLAATEAVLWSYGHQYLSFLATSAVAVTDGGMTVNSIDRKERVPDDKLNELLKYYPYKIRNVTRKGIQDEYYILNSLDALVDDISRFSWRPSADQARLTEVFGGPVRKLPMRSNIRSILTDLFIQIGSGQFHSGK